MVQFGHWYLSPVFAVAELLSFTLSGSAYGRGGGEFALICLSIGLLLATLHCTYRVWNRRSFLGRFGLPEQLMVSPWGLTMEEEIGRTTDQHVESGTKK